MLSYGSRATVMGPSGSSVSRDSAAVEGHYGQSAVVHQTTIDNASTGEAHIVDTTRMNGNLYAGGDGHVYRNSGGGGSNMAPADGNRRGAIPLGRTASSRPASRAQTAWGWAKRIAEHLWGGTWVHPWTVFGRCHRPRVAEEFPCRFR
jgi:hypothetical protein